jgi:hypothetical protein
MKVSLLKKTTIGHAFSYTSLAMLYATVSASFIIEQEGLPSLSDGLWNSDTPQHRLANFRMTRATVAQRNY